MELQEFFDDLESQFASKKIDWRENCNLLKVRTLSSQIHDLLAPIIGVDFVAGIERELGDWFVIALSHCATIQGTSVADDYPKLRQQEIELQEFIKTIDKPIRLTAVFISGAEHQFNLLDHDAQFLIAESGQLIPIKSITQLRILGTNQWP